MSPLKIKTESLSQKAFSHFSKTLLFVSIAGTISACSGGGSESGYNPNSSAGTQESELFISSFSTPDEEVIETEGRCEPSDFEMQVLQAINTARATPQLCGDEEMLPVQAVEWNCDLQVAATQHSHDMADNNFFSHQGSDGLRVNHRVNATKYEWASVGENIAAGYPGIDLVMQAWIDSPSHCTTLMNEDFEDVAVSLSFPEEGDYDIYWTMVLASPY